MNLFLDSLKHLSVSPGEKQRVEVNAPALLSEEETVTPFHPERIYLGKGQIYTDALSAYAALLEGQEQPTPPKYRNNLTKSFHKGTEEGQINSIFKDMKKYKKQIIPKISEFFTYIKSNRDVFPVCQKYIEYIQKDKRPDNPETYSPEGVVDLLFFKFWVLFKFYIETQK